MYILHCPQMATLAEKLVGRTPGLCPATVRWEHFDDGFPKLTIENTDTLRNQDIAFLASFDQPGEIFRQLSAIYEIPRYGVRSFKVVLPYYPTGTMERVDQDGQVATAATLAKMLSQIPLTISGPTQVIIYDIHALQERFYFSDQISPRLETAMPLLIKRLEQESNLAVAFPDDGAVKRFSRHFPHLPQIVFQKVRKGRRRSVTIREGNPGGRHVVIVDDLVMTGGTLLKCQELLLAKGAAQVSAFVTHGVFPQESNRNFTPEGFTRFWMTDSCPVMAEQLDGTPPFEVLSLAGPLSTLLQPGG